MKLAIRNLIFAVILLSIAACEKIDIKPVASKADIYISGSYRTAAGYFIAVYWKNGKMVKLITDSTTTSFGRNILVNGGDVYVTGNKPNSTTGFLQNVYWKNGVITELSGLTGTPSPPMIAINGNDVYVAGSLMLDVPQNSSSIPGYWKNGIPQMIQVVAGDRNIDITSVTVSGNDVYVCGAITTATSGLSSIATYWKNGVQNKLVTPANGNSYARAMAVQGNDVYVAGQIGSNGAYWKNGIWNILSADNASVYAIAVKGSDVYLAGVKKQTVNPTTGTTATYWKNGIANQIGNVGSTGNDISLATAIHLNGDDVYITGGFNVSPPSYFKNNVLVPFTTSPNALGYAMYVVNK
jgi:hypothetical protein